MPKSARSTVPTAWKLMIVISVLYLLCVWLGYRHLERTLFQRRSSGQVFQPKLSKDGLQLYVKQCPVTYSQRHGHLSGPVDTRLAKALKPGMCQASARPVRTNIQIESEWRSISVAYPQYVYTVSGWIQVLDVPTYTPKPLKVIIVPHSHQDPGWKSTFEGYFQSQTRDTLENMVNFLSAHPKWKFIWSEISFFEKWYSGEDGGDRERVKRLIDNGQLEIVTGGWVMTDEAVAHYSAMLDQLVEGHQWLKQNLDITPNTSWSVDTFGHSPTMAYLLKESGVKNIVIQRVHFAIKRYLAKKKSLEFMWRQSWDSSGKTDTLCHLMPFLLYAIHYSCGPDPHVCCQFDFHEDKCLRGTETVPRVAVNETNIRKLSWALWEQLQKKAELYRSNVLLVPHGDDFRYDSSSEWEAQFGNLEKLMEYMNKDPDMNINLEFGTVSDFFNALKTDTEKSKVSFPSLTGDFLPYNDRDDQYWTGFYTSRPLYKHMARWLHAKLRITDILLTLLCAGDTTSHYCRYLMTLEESLPQARQALALFQHHDAITGTSKRYVVKDYASKLHGASIVIDDILKKLMFLSVAEGQKDAKRAVGNVSLTMAEEWSDFVTPPSLKANYVDGKWFVLVTNPLTIQWKSVVTVRTSSPSAVKTKGGGLVAYQINPVLDENLKPVLGLYDVVFEADLQALSVKLYVVSESHSHGKYVSVTLFGKQLEPVMFVEDFKAKSSTVETIEIENLLLRTTFSSCTGTLQYTHRKLDDVIHKTAIKFVTYGTGSWSNPFRDKSGAYIFMPDGQARSLDSMYPPMVVLHGPVMSSVITKLPGVVHRAVLYNVSGPVASGVHLYNTVYLTPPLYDNKELVMRVESDVLSPDTSVCVDLNGFQMHKKRWRSKFLIQGNFHPVTSAAYIEDENHSRLSLLTTETHAVASLRPGWLEAVLDRRLMQDDWRGLNEGVSDNVQAVSRFMLVTEKKKNPLQTKGPACYPSLLTHLLSTHLNNPVQVVALREEKYEFKYKSEVNFMTEKWSCLYQLLNLRRLPVPRKGKVEEGQSALMIVQKAGLDCSYTEVYTDCDMQRFILLDKFLGVELSSVKQTTLTGVQELEILQQYAAGLKDMEIKAFKVTFK
ncbi:alpha-mannosidase 2 [Aplysia californica]|uniref:Alpha-mannosidase n=1 Tax=Aplysia californica TaxID=6500 RepID=A0ABM0JB32_APLCA|nr:alpha-mannosidase 2 [Aplysia californica]